MEEFDFQKIPQEEGERWMKEVFATHESPEEIAEILLSHNVMLVDVIAVYGIDAGRLYEIFRPEVARRKFVEVLNSIYGKKCVYLSQEKRKDKQ